MRCWRALLLAAGGWLTQCGLVLAGPGAGQAPGLMERRSAKADSLAVLALGWALQNSLHSLRSLRSIICCESEIDARSARPSPSLRPSAPLKSPWGLPRAGAVGEVARCEYKRAKLLTSA